MDRQTLNIRDQFESPMAFAAQNLGNGTRVKSELLGDISLSHGAFQRHDLADLFVAKFSLSDRRSISPDSTPDLARLNRHDCVLTHSEVASHRLLSPNTTKQANATHLLFSEFCVMVVAAINAFARPLGPRTPLIFVKRNPFQVLKTKVAAIAVDVIDLSKMIGVRKKRLSKKAVYASRPIRPIPLPELYRGISMPVDVGCLVGNAPDSTEVGDFIKRSAEDWSPFFGGCHSQQYDRNIGEC